MDFPLITQLIVPLFEYSVYIYNHRINKNNMYNTPTQMVYGTRISMSDITRCTFGKIGIFKDPSYAKMDICNNNPGEIGIIVGCEHKNPKNLKVFLLNSGKTVIRHSYREIQCSENIKSIIQSRNYDVEENVEIVNILNAVSKYSYENDIDVETLMEKFNINKFSVSTALKYLPERIVTSAINVELNNMLNENVFEFVMRGRKYDQNSVIDTLIFMKIKLDSENKYDKIKARIVARGDLQSADSYNSTYAPTLSTTGLYIILSLNKYIDGEIASCDISSAYLRAPIKEEIFVRIEKNISENLTKLNPSLNDYIDNNGNLIAKLNKSLYGLKQSGKNWNMMINEFLCNMKFKQSSIDQCIYYRYENDSIMFVGLFVDDLIFVYNNNTQMETIKKKFREKFDKNMKFVHGTLSYLGATITMNSDKTITISQSGYIEKLCKQFDIQRTFDTPSSANFFTQSAGDSLNQSEMKYFKSLLMTLMYIATKTRQDVLKEVIFLSTITNLNNSDLNKLKRVAGYLMSTKNTHIVLGITKLHIHVYADSSFGTHVDGKSHTGLVIKFDNSNILTKSYKQKSITLSSTEAELNALIDGIKVALPIIELIKQLINNSNIKSTIYQDNMSTIKIVNNLEKFIPRNKFLIIRYNFLMDFFNNIDKENINLEYLNTELMPADILTKVFTGKIFKLKVKLLGISVQDNK
jgi:hypothetical protein